MVRWYTPVIGSAIAAVRYNGRHAIQILGTASHAHPKLGGGQNVLVVNGSIVRDGRELPYCSCAFVYAHDEPLHVQAGPNGAELLVMQYPRERRES